MKMVHSYMRKVMKIGRGNGLRSRKKKDQRKYERNVEGNWAMRNWGMISFRVKKVSVR